LWYRQYTNVFAINSKAYLICGALSTNEVTQEVWCYDSKEDIWVQKNNFPAAARCGAYSFTIDQHGYFGCGQGVERYSDFWKYDPIDDHWERIADFPDGGRREGISFSCGGFGFAGLGVTTFDDAGHTDEIYKYNPLTNEWTSITPYPGGATSYAKAESFDVFAVVGGGQEGLLNFQSDFYMYDVLEDSWIQLEDYPEGGIRGAASFAIGNTVYFCTGLREDIIKTKSLYRLSVPISVSETKWQQSIRLFPNPSFGQIIITGKDWNTSTTLKIFNTEGKIVYNSIVYQGTINLNYLNSGAYILQLEREDGTVFSKKLHLF